MKTGIVLIFLGCLVYFGCPANHHQTKKMNYSDTIRTAMLEIIQQIDVTESIGYDLGRPVLQPIPELMVLAKKGPQIIPYMLPYLDENKPKQVAYLVHAIAAMNSNEGATTTAVGLVRDKISRKTAKTEWDLAAIGACNQVLKTTPPGN